MSNDNINDKGQDTSIGNFNNQESTILVEFTTGDQGLRPVGLFSRKKQPELAQKSNEAVNKAMSTIKNMAQRVHSTVHSIENKPKSVEVQFGVKFDAEVGVIVAKLTAEASMMVTLHWDYNTAQ